MPGGGNMRHTIPLVTLLITAIAGCSGGDSTGGLPDLAPPPPDLMPAPRGPYPAGPYGVDEGSILFDVDEMGYALSPDQTDSKQVPWTKIMLDTIHSNPQ